MNIIALNVIIGFANNCRADMEFGEACTSLDVCNIGSFVQWNSKLELLLGPVEYLTDGASLFWQIVFFLLSPVL